MQDQYPPYYPQPQPQRRARLGRFLAMMGLLFLVIVAAATYVVMARLNSETLAMLTGGFVTFVALMSIFILGGLGTIAVTRNSRDRWNGRDQREALPTAQPPVIVINPGGQISPYTNPTPPGYFSHTNKPREWDVDTLGGTE